MTVLPPAGWTCVAAAVVAASAFVAAARASNEQAIEAGPGGVLYRIDVPHFANGLPANDPVAFPGFAFPADRAWTDVQADELEAWWLAAESGLVEWQPAGTPLERVAPHRIIGGDLQGVVRHLDRIAALDIDGVVLGNVLNHRGRVGAHVGGIGQPSEQTNAMGWTRADAYLLGVLVPEAERRGLSVWLELDPDDRAQSRNLQRFIDAGLAGSLPPPDHSSIPATAELAIAQAVAGEGPAVLDAGLELGRLQGPIATSDPRHRTAKPTDQISRERFRSLVALRHDPTIGELLAHGRLDRIRLPHRDDLSEQVSENGPTERQDSVVIVIRSDERHRFVMLLNGTDGPVDATHHVADFRSFQRSLPPRSRLVDPGRVRWWLLPVPEANTAAEADSPG